MAEREEMREKEKNHRTGTALTAAIVAVILAVGGTAIGLAYARVRETAAQTSAEMAERLLHGADRMLLFGGIMTALLLIVFAAASVLGRRAARRRLLSERQETAAALGRAQKRAEFLSQMSHEIRTPLNGILGELYLARGNLDNRPALEENLGTIEDSAEYLRSLVNDILDMSKIEEGKMRLSPAANNAEEILRAVAGQYRRQLESKQITLEVSGAEPQPFSYACDRLRVTQVLLNLVSNAVKFTPAGGSITLSMAVRPLDAETDTIVYSVTDSGEGMTEEFLQRIFQPFEQAAADTAQAYGGSGLGLSIVKSLVDMMDGKIEVTSALGEGSSFVVSFPMKKQTRISSAQPRSGAPAAENFGEPFQSQHILVCEDQPVNAKLIRNLLSEWNLDVTMAKNGQVGLDGFLKSEVGFFSLIMMDVRMPVMDGCESAKAIRQSGRPDAASIPILAVSANYFEEDIRKALDAGMNGHVGKPFDIPGLHALLAEYFSEAQPGNTVDTSLFKAEDNS